MIITLAVRWWYGQGLKWAWQRAVTDRLEACVALFSMKDLVRTWAAPYKQTFAGSGGGGIGGWFRSAIDRMISRTVGVIVRSLLLLAGLIYALFILVTGILLLLLWPVLPFFVIVSVALQVGAA